MLDARPRLESYQRELLCLRTRKEGWSVSAAARAAGVSRQTAHKWLRRFDRDGPRGLAPRSHRPWRIPRHTRIDLVVRIYQLRDGEGLGPHDIGYALDLAPSTVYAVLRRAGISRRRELARSGATVRYEWPRPGDLVHLDTKKLGRILLDRGWRRLGRQEADRRRRRGRGAGYEFLHVFVDDHSRRADVHVLSDEGGAAAAAALRGVWSAYLRQGVRIKRILTDNGSCYRSRVFRECCGGLGIRHLRTRPYTPRTNGKAERFIKTLLERWAYRRLYRSTEERRAVLPVFLEDYRHRRTATLGGHTPMCRFRGLAAVNDQSGNHS